MGFEQPASEPSQEQLAQEYIAAYAEYKEISDRRNSDTKILDGLRDDGQSQEMFQRQQELLDSTAGEERRAMEKYVAIGDKLTAETRDKYLKPGSPEFLG